MADFERNLERPQPCKTSAPKFATVYRSHSAYYRKPVEITLGRTPRLRYNDPEQLLAQLERLHGGVLRGVVAIDFLQICDLPHPEGEQPKADSLIAERFKAIGLIGTSGLVEVKPGDILPPRPNEPGIGRTSRLIDTIREGTAVQLLASTPEERLHSPVIAIVEAAVSGPHQEVFIALRGDNVQSLLPGVAEMA